MITGKNYIGNELRASGNISFHTFNPEMNRENDWLMIEASEEEVKESVQKACSAFKSYHGLSDYTRAKFLNTIASKIERLEGDLILIYTAESGLSVARAKTELSRTLYQLRSFAEYILDPNWRRTTFDKTEKDRLSAAKPDLRKTHIALGPIVVFGSSNFPFAYSTAGGDTASALAAGCPVIVKSHPMHAGTGELVASAVIEAVTECNMPDGVFSNLNSSGIEVGRQLVCAGGIKAVGFTGSIQGGRSIFDLANKRPDPIPVFAEMGSINPVIISEKSLISQGDHWAKSYYASITNGTGQFCTKPGLIIGVQSDALNDFAQILANEINAVQPTCMLHPEIKSKYDTARSLVEKSESIEKISVDASHGNENYAEKVILRVSGEDFKSNSQLHHEVFGPFSIIVSCENLQQLNEVIDKLEGQLTGTIIMQDDEYAIYRPTLAILKHKVGRVIFNGVPTGVEVSPSMNHGGPYPATTDSRFTAVGVHAIYRWLRPITYQNFPSDLLPAELQ